jgi:putative membrane protein
MTPADVLPHLNAGLNVTALALLCAARIHIHRKDVVAHRRAMLWALGVSALFLVSYTAYHFAAPIFHFRGEGLVRPFYYTLLISHVTLAALAIPMILASAWMGLKRRDAQHRRWVRWTWPLWVYVSISGVAVYLMLHHIFR